MNEILIINEVAQWSVLIVFIYVVGVVFGQVKEVLLLSAKNIHDIIEVLGKGKSNE